MKKAVITLFAIALVAVWTCSALSAGTESNWSVVLQFKQEGATPDAELLEDVMETTLGVSSTEPTSVLKPPALPRYNITAEPTDVYVNAYIKTQTARAATSLDYETTPPETKFWVVDVEADVVEGNNKDVYLAVDFTDSYFDKVTVYVPGEANPVKEFRRTGTTEQMLYESDGETKTVIVMAGDAASVAVADKDDKIYGLIDAGGIALTDVDGVTVNLYDDSCNLVDTTTTTDGLFTFSGVANGTYTIQATKQYYVGSAIKSLAKSDVIDQGLDHVMYTGDFNDDKRINLFDIAEMKTSIGLTSTQEGWDSKFDTNKDDSINLFDIAELKAGFDALEQFDCGN